jgi:hypothetical protein
VLGVSGAQVCLRGLPVWGGGHRQVKAVEGMQLGFGGVDPEVMRRVTGLIEWVDTRKAEPAFGDQVGCRLGQAETRLA